MLVGAAHRRAARPGHPRARRRRRAPRPAARGRADDLHALDAHGLRAAADLHVDAAREYMRRERRLGRADHGAAAGRAPRATRRLRAHGRGLPAHELPARRPRGLAPGPRLPPRRGPRALRRGGGGDSPRPRHAGVPGADGLGGGPRPRAVRGDRRRGRLAPPRRAARHPHRARRLRAACSTASRAWASTSWRAARARPRAWSSGRCGRDAASHRSRRRADVAGRPGDRRPGVRRELRGTGRRPRAGGKRRAGPARGPLRGRRARDVRLRGAHAVAGGDGRERLHPPGDPVHGLPHPPRQHPLPAALELVGVRLPRAVPAAPRAVRRRLRDRDGERPHRRGRCTPTGATCARR